MLGTTPEPIIKIMEMLRFQLEQLLASPIIRFDESCRRSLPEQPGVYRIFHRDRPNATIRTGRTDAELRQRVYQNHLMGNQAGNLPAQLVSGGDCVDLNAAKQFMRQSLAVQVLPIADAQERASLEHFILAVLQPRYSDKSQGKSV